MDHLAPVSPTISHQPLDFNFFNVGCLNIVLINI